MATIVGFDDTLHTLIDRSSYFGGFLPNYTAHPSFEPVNQFMEGINLQRIDHVGIPQPEGSLGPVTEAYYRSLDFHHFWSVDETIVKSKLSSLRSTVISDFDEVVKMPVFEPSPGIKKSQVQEFIEYNGGAGSQHVAFNTGDIIQNVSSLKVRNV